MTVDIATLAIRIDSLEARNAARDMDRMRDAGGRAEQQVSALDAVTRKLAQALALLGVGAGVGAIIRMADEYTKFTAQLRLATESQRQYATAMDDVRRIANTAQQDLASTGVLYARIANGTRELGVQQKQVASITEVVNLALKVSGATASESASAMLQLSQSFASGTLRGEEFNAVNEAAPRLMKALADGIGVPVGALKKMAEEGAITSKIMADVLPRALNQLQEEAKQVQTISGAFTVLKNKIMEFTGVQAQASGTVSVLTSAIGMLANNLTLLAGVTGTLVAVNLGNWLASLTIKTYERITAAYAQVAAENAARAATIAAAEADLARATATGAQAATTKAAIIIAREEAVARLSQARSNILSANAAIEAATAAGAQSFALRTLRLATAELAVAEAARIAMTAELALLGQQQARVSAQIAAATAAQTAAQTALNAANGAGVASVGLLGRAIGFLGGPIGAVITVLGLAATAWMVWGNKGAEAEKKVTATLAEEIDEYLANLDKQIAKLKERNELASKKMTTGAEPVTDGDKKRESILAEINRISKDTDMDIATRTQVLAVWGGKLNAVTQDMERFNVEQKKNSDLTKDARAIKWLGEHGSAAQRLAAELEKLKKEFGEIPPAIEAVVRAKYADKGAAATAKADLTASLDLIKAGIDAEKAVRADGLADIAELNRQGMASDATLFEVRYAGTIEAGRSMAQAMDAEIAQLQRYHGKDAAEREANAGKVAVLENQKAEAIRASMAAAARLRSAYDYDKGKPERDAQDLANKEVAAINQQVMAVERQIEAYNKLPAAVTAGAIAELEAQKATVSMIEGSEAAVAVINDKITALGKLAAKQAQYSALDTGSDVAKAKELLDILTAVDAATRQAAASMADSFGRVGSAIGGLTTALSGYAVQQQAIAAQLAAVKADPKSNAQKIAQAEIAASKASAQAQIKSYGDMAGAAKGFFKENTAGYKIMEGTEKAFRAVEMAMAVKNMLEKSGLLTAFTGLFVASKAAESTAIVAQVPVVVAAEGAKQGAFSISALAAALTLPPPASFAAFAATAALLAAIGIGVAGGGGGGGGKSAAEIQKTQGTGSVFGDKDAKSESIARALERLEEHSGDLIPLNQGMLSALRSIEASMKGLTNLVVRTPGLTDGKGFGIQEGTTRIGNGVTDTVTKLTSLGVGSWTESLSNGLAKLWGKTTQTIIDSGVQFGGSVRGLQSGQGYDQYASVDTTKSSWFGLSKKTSNSVQTAGLSDELSSQFGLIFTGVEKALSSAAVGLGVGAEHVTAVLDALTIETTKVSLKGLTGEALTEALNSVISKAMDDMSKAVFPEFEKFREVGEGYTETVVRLAQNYAQVDQILNSFGATFGAIGIGSLEARERFIALAGGMDTLSGQASSFADNFLTEAERLAPVQKYVTDSLAGMGLASLDTRDKFKDYITGQINGGALLTEAGAGQISTLLALSEAFALTHAATVDLSKSTQAIADERADLQGRLDQATMTSIQLLDQERASKDLSNRAFFDQVIAAEAARAAADALANTNAQLQADIDALVKASLPLSEQRALEVAGMAASTLALYSRREALQAEAKAAADAQAALAAQVAADKAATEKLAGTNAGFQQQIDTILKARMTEAQVRELETAGMAASTLALYDRLAALKAEDAAVVAATKARADAEAAASKVRADAEQMMQSYLSASTAAYEKSMSDRAALAAQYASKETELYNLTHTEAEVLARTRQLELDSMPATVAALQLQIYAQQDLAAAATKAAAEIQAAAQKAAAIASEGASIRRDVLQLQGDTAGLRALELAALDPANRAAKQAYFDMQDKIASDQAATAAAQVWAQAQQQVAQAAVSMKSAIQGLTDTLFDEVDRIRGLIDGGGQQSYASSQSAFAIATAQARAGDQEAAKLLPGLSKAMLDLAEANAVTAFDLRLARAQAAASLAQTGSMIGAQYGIKVPSYDVGTDYVSQTGFALIHEGEKITPAASNRPFTSAGSGMSEVVEELRAIRSENAALRAELADFKRSNTSGQVALIKSSDKTANAVEGSVNGQRPLLVKLETA